MQIFLVFKFLKLIKRGKVAKKHYESYIIVDGNFEDTVIDEIINKYDAFLKKNESTIVNIEKIGRRRMAYAIKKKQNGYYICFHFEADTQVMSKLERVYRLDENILRHLTVHMSKKELKEKDDYLKKKALAIETAINEQKAAEPAVENKVAEEIKIDKV
ncbi:30S ribosomal protein S6 [bacterium]|nr:MAG: 30S ribosomal protein S6 [bacterium]